MKYISTRGDRTERGFSDILLEGLAPDGGLYLPIRYPKADAKTLSRWRGLLQALRHRLLRLRPKRIVRAAPPVLRQAVFVYRGA